MKYLNLILLLFLYLTSVVSGQEKDPCKNITTVAFLDSGIDFDKNLKLKKYNIQSIDLTGEGIIDINGHGTLVVTIFMVAAEWPDPSSLRILNIKILDKNLKTDEITLLRGLYEASERGANSINLSAGVWIDKKNANQCSRQFLQWNRRYPDIKLYMAAGNYPNYNPIESDLLFFPQYTKVVIEKLNKGHILNDAFDDAVYSAKFGRFELANDILVGIIAEFPKPTLEQKAFMLRQGMLYTEMAYKNCIEGNTSLCNQFSAKAIQTLDDIVSFKSLFEALKNNSNKNCMTKTQ